MQLTTALRTDSLMEPKADSRELLRLHNAALLDGTAILGFGEERLLKLLDFEESLLRNSDLLARRDSSVVLCRVIEYAGFGWNPLAAQSMLTRALSLDPELLMAVTAFDRHAGTTCQEILACAREKSEIARAAV